MTTVTVYPTLITDQIEFILKNSDTKLIFVENIDQFNKINKIFGSCEHLKYIVVMNDNDLLNSDFDCAYNFNEFCNFGNIYKKITISQLKMMLN